MGKARQIRKRAPGVLSGTNSYVSQQLHRSPGTRAVAITFAGDEQGAAAERVLHQVVEFLPQLIHERQEETLKKLVNVFLTDVTPSKAAREQARMLIQAKRDILS